jgi:hypothetical protein
MCTVCRLCCKVQGKDYTDALSSKIEQIVNASVEKVKADGKKKTLGAEDL